MGKNVWIIIKTTMTSIGDNVIIPTLTITERLIVNGSMETNNSVEAHQIFGSDDKNLVQMHQVGSVFYIKYSHFIQIDSFQTTANSREVVIAINGTHAVADGDTVHIDTITDAVSIGGIPVASIHGTRLVHAVDDSTMFRLWLGVPATSNEVTTSVQPLVRVDRYKSTDMRASDGTWTAATVAPTPTHTNILTFAA